MKRIRAKSTKLVFSDFNFELEKRQLLVTTSFSSGLLTINLDAVGEILTLTSDGTTLSLSSSAAISGAGSSFATSSVNHLAVSDSGLLAGQLSRLLSMRAGLELFCATSVKIARPRPCVGPLHEPHYSPRVRYGAFGPESGRPWIQRWPVITKDLPSDDQWRHIVPQNQGHFPDKGENPLSRA